MSRMSIEERKRIKRRQMLIRKYTKVGVVAAFAILLGVFLVRGVIQPLMGKAGGGGKTSDISAGDPDDFYDGDGTTYELDTGNGMASRIPVSCTSDTAKSAELTPGWHDNNYGRWYENPDGTFYADGFQEIDGVQYSFDGNGYIQTGWVTSGAAEYYFNEDGSYNPDQKRPMLALTFDDGPSQYTMELLNCLEENNAHATFFMLGELVGSFPDEVRKMAEIGCELGNHSYDHSDMLQLDLDSVYKQFNDTDNKLIEACGQASTVGRCPYGNGNADIYQTVGKPFVLWSLDTLDWKLLDADADYQSVMNGDLSDGTIILMHDIHQPSVQAALRIIPELVQQGYKLVTVSEMAAAKGVQLQNTVYVDFWQSDLDAGNIPGYTGSTGPIGSAASSGTSDSGTDELTDGTDEVTDGSEADSSGDLGSGDEDTTWDYDESYEDSGETIEYYDDYS